MIQSTAIVLRSHYYPELKQHTHRKPRTSRVPIKHKIGKVITTPDELLLLIEERRSVVIHNHLLLPAINVSMWQFSVVMKLLNTNKINEYLKHEL